MRAVSHTAEFMAFFRALEGARPAGERLFEDPCAAALLPPALRRVVSLAKFPSIRAGICALVDGLVPGARNAAVARTRLIDDAMAEALAQGIEQVVILGVGFDCRTHRLSGLARARVFEVDRSTMLAERSQRLAALVARPLGATVPVPIDFDREPLGEALAAVGFDVGRRAFFLAEGVTNYLARGVAESLLRTVGSAARGSRLLFTYVDRDVIEHPEWFDTRLLGGALRRFGERWTSGFDPGELSGSLERAGLELLWDEGSTEFRERYLGRRHGAKGGYEFYRAALARVP